MKLPGLDHLGMSSSEQLSKSNLFVLFNMEMTLPVEKGTFWDFIFIF